MSNEKTREDFLREQLAEANRTIAALKGVITKLKKRKK